MAFPISLTGNLPFPSASASADPPADPLADPNGSGEILAGLESVLRRAGLTAARRTSSSLGFEGGWRAPWPLKGCGGTLEIERDGDQGARLAYRLSFQAWAIAMTAVVPLIAYLLLWPELGIAPVLRFGILLVGLPIGWLGAMALVHRLIGARARRRLEQLLQGALS